MSGRDWRVLAGDGARLRAEGWCLEGGERRQCSGEQGPLVPTGTFGTVMCVRDKVSGRPRRERVVVREQKSAACWAETETGMSTETEPSQQILAGQSRVFRWVPGEKIPHSWIVQIPLPVCKGK